MCVKKKRKDPVAYPVILKLGVLLDYKNNIFTPSSCEIEYFAETHLCKLCAVILLLRVLHVVCPRSVS